MTVSMAKRFLLALCLWSGWQCATAEPGRLVEVENFGSNPGALQMFLHVPDGLPAGAPLVVVAHGCTQDAQTMADRSGWPTLADKYQFAVLFPQTSKINEPLAGCFRTWEPGHQQRGRGEPLSVQQMVGYMIKRFRLASDRVFITGMSSGGHLTNVMLATYPELFAAGAPMSSFPYRCAMELQDLGPCSHGGRVQNAQALGELVRSGYPGYSGSRPAVQIWHGAKDEIIHPSSQLEQVKQWTNALGIDGQEGRRQDLAGQPRLVYGDGAARVESVTVEALGHAVAVDPGDEPNQCGAVGPYAQDVGLCAAYWIGRFFGVVL